MLAPTSSTVDRDASLKAFVDSTREATGTQVCSIYLWDENSRRLVLTATNGLAAEGVGIVSMRLGKGVTGWVADNRRSLAVPDTREEPRFHWMPGLDQERFVSMLSVPVLAGSRLVGVVNVQTEQIHHFTEAEVAHLEAIASQVAPLAEQPETSESAAAARL